MTRSTITARTLSIAALACFALIRPHPANAAPLTVAVEAAGSIPGIKDATLTAYLAGAMNNANGGTFWHFIPAAAVPARGGAQPPDRVEWTFKNISSAVGSVRGYGFGRGIMDRLLGVHHYLSVQVTLFLNDQYQTQSLLEITTTGGTGDTALTAQISQEAHQLMAYATQDDGSRKSSRGNQQSPS